MSSEEEFSRELINFFRDNESLYNHYVNEEKWKEIGNNLNRSGGDCRKKWYDLKRKFNKEHKKVTNGEYVSNWPYYESMESLVDYLFRSERTNNKQMELLVCYMEKHGDLSKSSATTQQQNQMWGELITKLNSMGPPNKTDSQWRKVYKDKYRTKAKQIAKPEGVGPQEKNDLVSSDRAVSTTDATEAFRATSSTQAHTRVKLPDEKPATSTLTAEEIVLAVLTDSPDENESPEIKNELEMPSCSKSFSTSNRPSQPLKRELFETRAKGDENFQNELLNTIKEGNEMNAKLLKEQNEIIKDFVNTYKDNSNELLDFKYRELQIKIQKLEALFEQNKL